MFTVSRSRRKFLTGAAGLTAVAALSACGPMPMGGAGLPAGKPVPVALLVPSGSASSTDLLLAQSLENAARLAIADLQGVQIDLRVYGTAGQAAQAASAATQAVNDGALVILGPLYAHSANAAGNAVRGSGVNVLSFSNNADVAGGNVFVLGPTFDNTADRLVSFAARQGKRRIVMVHARTPAGELARAAVTRAAARSAATVVATVGYEMSQNGVVSAASQVVSAAKANGADLVVLDATTDGALPVLSQLIREQGLTSDVAQVGGLARWDVPAQAAGLPGLQGGIFALPNPGLTQQFEARYTAAYGTPPVPAAVVGLAYDGIAAVGALVKMGKTDLSAAALTQGAGFAGVSGVFRLRPDGTNQRGLAIAQIQNSQVVVIDPAPTSFGGAGF
ncbi:MAG: penicillin-binding protein activator [Defluviimonas sp.]|uniref:penicillin-binding protein activator n=1 Tax=Albidovulum sp. TaxID=1872424 RepID=UPI001D95E1DB|nr:penicillin-binding protein activator [Paracoccaceae bacterium]MCC0065294.1 penicillin-binding protein activator [Defluviimonas sp.]